MLSASPVTALWEKLSRSYFEWPIVLWEIELEMIVYVNITVASKSQVIDYNITLLKTENECRPMLNCIWPFICYEPINYPILRLSISQN